MFCKCSAALNYKGTLFYYPLKAMFKLNEHAIKFMEVKLEAFRKLNVLQKAILVWQYAIPVDEINDPLYVYALFQLYDFYVELQFCKTDKVFCEMRSFSAQSPYLDL